MISTVEVRHPYVNEVPEELVANIGAWKVDPEWQWVLVVDGKIKAQLLCCDAHGVLMMLRITSLPDAPNGWALIMFRSVLKECEKLGMLGYMTFLTDDNKPERRLMSIAARAGGYLIPVSGTWVAGSLEVGY